MLLALSTVSVACLALLATPVVSASLVPTIPNYFCYGDAVVAWNLIVYFGTNYFLHAAAVLSSIDIGRYTERLGLVSLFTPFFALARTIILIAEQIKCKGDDVRAALHHGALLVVVRGTNWEPSIEGEVIYARLPDNYEPETDNQTTQAFIAFDDRERNRYSRTDPNERLIHGIARPGPDYALAVPAHKACIEEIMEKYLEDTTDLKIHHPPGLTNVLLSIFQIIFASFTIYFTPSDQNPRWGYTAYGLSVFPYALMSVVNLVCAGFVGGYTSGRVLRTPILEESFQPGRGTSITVAKFDGIIGSLKKGRQPQVGDIGTGEYVAVKMCTVPATSDTSPKMLVVAGDTWERTYTLLHEGQTAESSKAVRFTLSALNHAGPLIVLVVSGRPSSWT
ncbi:hypothetical protein C8Q72DRAFT_917675 [Fomitopsis betulina]|nr:hypothetical protein C8Q72DRAFT_917675 [Fomitopsis betulina]